MFTLYSLSTLVVADASIADFYEDPTVPPCVTKDAMRTSHMNYREMDVTVITLK